MSLLLLFQGQPQATTMNLRWAGPFNPGQIIGSSVAAVIGASFQPLTQQPVRVFTGSTYRMPISTASGYLSSDPGWWTQA